MKKTFAKVLALMIIFIMSMSMVTLADQKPITVFLNGEQLEFDVQPTLESGRTLVPMRVIFEALGAKVDWDNNTFTAIAVKDDITIKITIDDMKLYKNDEVIELDVPARLIDGRTLVPARAVSEGMGAKVDWDNENWRVDITTVEEPNEEKAYKFNELSDTDRKALDNLYGDLRYTFEQFGLPELFATAEGMNQMLLSRDSYISEMVKTDWDYAWLSFIMYIQMNSEDIYNISYDNMETDDIDAEYNAFLKDLGYNSENFFETAYYKTSGGNTVFLITFKENASTEHITCKYIGVTVDKANKVRYFTAEVNPFIDADIYFLCEVKQNSNTRGTYYQIPTTRNDFFEGIDSVLRNNLQYSVSQTRQ